MLVSGLVGLAAGFVLAIPPGPIAVAIIKQGIQRKVKAGTEIGIGAAVMDMLYALLAAFASSALVSALTDKITGNEWLMLGFQLASICVLVFLGIRYLRPSSKSIHDTEAKEAAQEKKAERLGFSSPFVVGVLIALTNLASPTFLPSFIFVIGLFQSRGWIGHFTIDNILYAVGFGIGTAIWFLLLLRIITLLRDKLSPNFVSIIYNIAAGSMLIFACVLAYHVVVATPWSSLLH
jgi:threonine/homoserine/homoserine lactone efflux protein